MNIPADFSLNDEDFQLRDFFEMLELQQFQVSHFVGILIPCVYLDVHAALNIACLTLLKIASITILGIASLPVLYPTLINMI